MTRSTADQTQASASLKPLASAVPEIRRNHGVEADYNAFYRQLVLGTIPVTRIGGRIYVDTRDYAAIAAVLRQVPIRRRRLEPAA